MNKLIALLAVGGFLAVAGPASAFVIDGPYTATQLPPQSTQLELENTMVSSFAVAPAPTPSPR
jgi:hypothetical protein